MLALYFLQPNRPTVSAYYRRTVSHGRCSALAQLLPNAATDGDSPGVLQPCQRVLLLPSLRAKLDEDGTVSLQRATRHCLKALEGETVKGELIASWCQLP